MSQYRQRYRLRWVHPKNTTLNTRGYYIHIQHGNNTGDVLGDKYLEAILLRKCTARLIYNNLECLYLFGKLKLKIFCDGNNF